jgi:histidine triad (HIT) family protein
MKLAYRKPDPMAMTSAQRLASEIMSDQCVFCGIIAGNIPSVKVAEDDATFAFMDINPASDGHLLVVPKRHSRDLFDIPEDDLTAVTLAAQRIARAAFEELGADGVNLLNCCRAAAWQTVFHFHWHVIPRYADKANDRLVLPWKPWVQGDADKIAALGTRLAALS